MENVTRKKTTEQYKMSLPEKITMVAMSIQAILQGYKNSRLITGCLEENTELNLMVDEELYKKIIQNRE